MCFGRPLPVDDGRRRFLVYPFLFQLTDADAAISLNWENTEAAWVAPRCARARTLARTPCALAGSSEPIPCWRPACACAACCSEVPQLAHVPLLPETVRRLLLPPYMASHVAYLKSDRQHGAAELAAYVLQALAAAQEHELRSSGGLAAGSGAALDDAAGNYLQQHPALGQLDGRQPSFESLMEAYTNFLWHMAVVRRTHSRSRLAAHPACMMGLPVRAAVGPDAHMPGVCCRLQARPSMAAVANAAVQVMLQLQQEVAARADAFEPTAGVARCACCVEAVCAAMSACAAAASQVPAA